MEGPYTELSLAIDALMLNSNYSNNYQSIAINFLILANKSFKSIAFPSMLILLLKKPDLGLPAEIGTKVGSGVLVSDSIFDRMIEHHSELLDKLYVDHNIDLLGTHCKCSVACPSTKLFLGSIMCQQMIQKYLLLSELVIPDVASIICEKLLQ